MNRISITAWCPDMSVHVPAGNARIKRVCSGSRFTWKWVHHLWRKPFIFQLLIKKMSLSGRGDCVWEVEGSWRSVRRGRGSEAAGLTGVGLNHVSMDFINMSLLAKWYSLCLSRFISELQEMSYCSDSHGGSHARECKMSTDPDSQNIANFNFNHFNRHPLFQPIFFVSRRYGLTKPLTNRNLVNKLILKIQKLSL